MSAGLDYRCTGVTVNLQIENRGLWWPGYFCRLPVLSKFLFLFLFILSTVYVTPRSSSDGFRFCVRLVKNMFNAILQKKNFRFTLYIVIVPLDVLADCGAPLPCRANKTKLTVHYRDLSSTRLWSCPPTLFTAAEPSRTNCK